MGTARFDDATPDCQKFDDAGPAASWLWFCSVLYCRRALTDGFVPRAKIPTLVPSQSARQCYQMAATLVSVNLWHEVEGGYQVHDFLDWNPTKAAMTEYRKRDRERKHQKHGIRDPKATGIRTESERNPNDAANAGATHAGAKSESKSELGEKDDAPTRPARPASHDGCYPATAACRRGVCLAMWLGANWVRQVGDPIKGDAEVQAAVREGLAALAPGPLGVTPRQFWEGVWARRHGGQQAVNGRSAGPVVPSIDETQALLQRARAERAAVLAADVAKAASGQ